MAFFINWLSFAIIAADSLLLLIYSTLVKRKSGFAANVLVGVLTGTAFMYGEATISGTVSLISLSLYPIAFGTIGGNVLRDILSLDGDSKIGYPTLPQKIGISKLGESGCPVFHVDWVACASSLLHRQVYNLLFASHSSYGAFF